MNEEQTRRKRRWLVAALKCLIVVVVVWFIRQNLMAAWQDVSQHGWRLSWKWLVLSGVFYLIGTGFSGLFWHRVLLAMGQVAGLGETLRAFYIGHLGKYVPGKAMVVVLRTGLIRSQQVDATLAAVSVFFETLTMMAVGAFGAAAIVAVWFRGQPLLFWASVAMMFAAGAPTIPPVFRRVVRLLGIGKRAAEVIDVGMAGVGFRIWILGWVLNTFGWLFLGLSLWAVINSIEGTTAPFSELHVYTGAVSLATVAGFVSFIPAGAIVREAVLEKVMSPQFGVVVAVGSAVLLRLVWLVSELLLSGILYMGARRRISRHEPPSLGE